MKNFLTKLFSSQKKEIVRLQGLVGQINDWEGDLERLTKDQISKQAQNLKKKLGKEGPENLLPEAFALVREAAKRTIGQRHFDVQMMAAIALFEGKIIEQKTGEGKTLAATPALFLRALEGKGAHLVTVNDYLARRDAGWMGQIFHLLGLSTGGIIHDQGFIYDPEFSQKADDDRLRHLRPVERRQAYQADITYGTNNEFGFDYLRDNMAHNLVDKVQRLHYFAIVDEVDFALIDEARTPLIISSPEAEPTEKYYQFARLIRSLSVQTDYLIDEESRSVSLTDHGITKIEKSLGVDNLYEKDFETIHHIENALKAKELFRLDRDYVIKDGEVVIVDEFTGRLMFGRRWSGGLHQAVEAKEGVEIKQESKTLATISFQNYFRLYQHLSGMTGTALTSAEEFRKIYHLETLAIPTNRSLVRKDYEDAIFKNQRAKYTAVANEVAQYYQKGQPVLVGTTSIEKNEIISRLLKHKKIPHQVLNAKNHEKEASILAQAGARAAVTVATNMAGRGVDIVLGGEEPKIAQSSKLKAQNYEENHKTWQKKHDEVVGLGGLHVIGTERHEARRIDDQLRGRAGRQGDPGSSRFFIALDDDMMRVFGGQQIASLMSRFNFPDEIPIENRLISRSIEQIQSKVEGVHFDARKRLVEYDDVANKQREIVYRVRDRVLALADQEDLEGLKNNLSSRVNQEIDNLIGVNFTVPSSDSDGGEINLRALVQEFAEILPLDTNSQQNLIKVLSNKNQIEVKNHLESLTNNFYQGLVKKMGERKMIEINKLVLLSTIDRLWVDHLDQMEDLREGVAVRSYGQQDPLSIYRHEAFEQFEQLMSQVDYQVARRIFRVQFAVPNQPSIFRSAQTNIDNQDGMGLTGGQDVFGQAKQTSRAQTVVHKTNPPGRNDPCPCGAKKKDGTPKKYKHCCYPKYG
ncbi:MAG: preprotein translocase subunit SecA [Candidatus Shapirobacteria bacterium]|nr:preprotein translocase subunit SecA [Candidatus Shapirobacteria bacterium]